MDTGTKTLGEIVADKRIESREETAFRRGYQQGANAAIDNFGSQMEYTRAKSRAWLEKVAAWREGRTGAVVPPSCL